MKVLGSHPPRPESQDIVVSPDADKKLRQFIRAAINTGFDDDWIVSDIIRMVIQEWKADYWRCANG